VTSQGSLEPWLLADDIQKLLVLIHNQINGIRQLVAMGVASSLALEFLEMEAMQQLQRDLHVLEYVWPSGGDPCMNWVGVSCANNHVDSIRLTGLPRENQNETFWQPPPQQLQLAASALDALRELPYLRELNACGFLLPGDSIPDWLGSALPALVSLDSLLVFSTVPSPTLLVQRA
jgi:hypothetical protein